MDLIVKGFITLSVNLTQCTEQSASVVLKWIHDQRVPGSLMMAMIQHIPVVPNLEHKSLFAYQILSGLWARQALLQRLSAAFLLRALNTMCCFHLMVTWPAGKGRPMERASEWESVDERVRLVVVESRQLQSDRASGRRHYEALALTEDELQTAQ